MDFSRGRIENNRRIRFEDVLSPVDLLDRNFSVSEPRSLDVFGISIEITYRRSWFELVETEAPFLINGLRLYLTI